jgi:two-component system chemotaxis response regulator CheV
MAYGLLESIDSSTRLAGHNRLALLLFRLGTRQIFGINVFKVQEVLKVPALTHMPGAHPQVRGVLDLRGRVVPVIDLRRAIGLADDPGLPPPAHLVVAEFNRSVQAFLVAQVERIVHLDVAELQPPPADADADGDHYLTAIARFQNQDVGIIDVEKVLAEILGGPAGLSDALSETVRGLDTGGLKVLIVDDSRVARSQIEGVLEQLGIPTLSAKDGREALELLQMLAAQAPIDEQLLMVISDVEMPTMDGYRLTTEIRRDPALHSLYVLLHSSLSGGFNTAMVEKVGADRFIAKFSSDELARAVIERLENVIATH